MIDTGLLAILRKQTEAKSPQNYFASRCLDLLAEIERLYVIEEKAKAVVKTMVCKNTDLADFEGLCDRFDGCNDCELKALEDALKGSDND